MIRVVLTNPMSIMQATLLMALAAVFSDSPIEGIGRGVGVVGGGAGNQNIIKNLVQFSNCTTSRTILIEYVLSKDFLQS